MVSREFVVLCRKLNLFAGAFVAIDGIKFKEVNNRDRNFIKATMARRLQQIDESINRYKADQFVYRATKSLRKLSYDTAWVDNDPSADRAMNVSFAGLIADAPPRSFFVTATGRECQRI